MNSLCDIADSDSLCENTDGNSGLTRDRNTKKVRFKDLNLGSDLEITDGLLPMPKPSWKEMLWERVLKINEG